MIRVLLRDAEEVDAVIVGDFSPGEIDGVEALVKATPVFDGDTGPEHAIEVRRQWVLAKPPATPRWCLELIWTG